MTTKWNRLLLTLSVAGMICAAPAPALAHNGTSGGGSDDALVQPTTDTHSGADDATAESSDTHAGSGGESSADTSEHGGRHGGSGHSGNDANRSERYQLRGTVASVDPTTETLVVTVKKANHGHRGRRLVAQTITFDVSSARIDVKDVNGDGVRDLNDIAVGDAVEVRADLPRSGTPDLSAPIAASRVKDRSAGHADANAGADDAPNHG